MGFRTGLLSIAALLSLALALPAASEPFKVEVFGVDRVKQAFGIPAAVAVSGDIESSSPQQLERALQPLKDVYYWVYLDSPGGNLFAGMELGRVLRKHGAVTIVARPVRGATYENRSGGCYSACALAFLGGTYRLKKEGSVYGVHRAYRSQPRPAANDLDVGQVLAAAVGAYIREMGVDGALYDLIASAGADEIRVLSEAEQLELQVVNEGRQKPEWSIEALEGGMYLRGIQHTIHGMGKAMFVCDRGEVLFWSVYDAGPERSTSLAETGMMHSMFVDNDTVRLPQQARMFDREGWLNTMISLTREQAVRAMGAKKSLGHAMQASYEAPSFIGYRVDIDAESGDKVRNFLTNCVAQMK